MRYFAAALLFLAGTAQAQYETTLNRLSEPAETRWQQFATPYFSTNEKLLNRFYSRFDHLGGVVVGVSFQQNLSLLVHAHPERSVIFDINPGLTEILIPFFGKLFERCPTRRQFLSMLLGMDITAQQTVQLLEHPTEQLPETLGPIFDHASESARQLRIEALRQILRDEIFPRLPSAATPAMRARSLTWIDLLEQQEILSGNFFHDATEVPFAGWLSTEDNYRLVRRYWREGRIIGITGDISGPSIDKLSQYLRTNQALDNPRVTGLYLSNVGASVNGHFPMSWFQNLYARLATLPLDPNAVTLIAQGPYRLTAFAEPFTLAKWAHDTLADVPTSLAIQLHEAPLEAGVQFGRPAVLASLRQRAKTPDCLALIRRIEANPGAIHSLPPAAFAKWASPADTNSPEFRTLTVTLVESGYLPAP